MMKLLLIAIAIIGYVIAGNVQRRPGIARTMPGGDPVATVVFVPSWCHTGYDMEY